MSAVVDHKTVHVFVWVWSTVRASLVCRCACGAFPSLAQQLSIGMRGRR